MLLLLRQLLMLPVRDRIAASQRLLLGLPGVRTCLGATVGCSRTTDSVQAKRAKRAERTALPEPLLNVRAQSTTTVLAAAADLCGVEPPWSAAVRRRLTLTAGGSSPLRAGAAHLFTEAPTRLGS